MEPKNDADNGHRKLKEFENVIDATSSFIKAIAPPVVKLVKKLKFRKKSSNEEKAHDKDQSQSKKN